MMQNGENDNVAREIASMVYELREAKRTIKEKEEEISQLKAMTKEMEEVNIPEVMFEHGINAITLFSGIRVEVKPFYFARVPKDNPQPFYSWLRGSGHGALIKAHFEEWATDPQAVEDLKTVFAELDIPYELSEGIHWKTLEAWFKEQTEHGTKLPVNLFENYVGRKAIVK